MATTQSTRSRSRERSKAARPVTMPVLRVTRYDRVSSFLMALIMGIFLLVTLIIAHWFSIRPERPLELIPLEMVEIGGGFEDGNPDETLQVESPLEVNPNASPIDEAVEQEELMETLETVVELSDRATQQVQQVMTTSNSTGTPGSAVGNGGRPLGAGGGPGSGVPAWQRWFIQFNEASVSEYARQLDHFGIEIAVFYPNSGNLVYVKGVSGGSPSIRRVDKWTDERVYFRWSGGARERIDRDLLQKAGVDTKGGQIFQFYPDDTVRLLATIEQNYANRSAKEIRRTYFAVVTQGRGYDFSVTRQTYLR